MAERIYDTRFDYDPDQVLIVEEEDTPGELKITTIDGEHSTLIVLGDTGVRALRLALQRWERRQS